MNSKTIIYHRDCTDGFSSAVILSKRLSTSPFPVSLIALNHGDELPLGITGDIYMLDFSYPREYLLQISSTASNISIYDHHKTTIEDLRGVEESLKCPSNIILDLDRAACQITWDESFPGLVRPKSIERIADRDLGRFVHPETRNITAFFYKLPQDVSIWSNMLKDENYETALSLGSGIENAMQLKIDSIIKDSSISRIGDHLVSYVNTGIEFASDAGEAMLLKHPEINFSVSYREVSAGFHFSLRSRENEFDVAKFAENFSGGGHAVSAGFISETLPWTNIVSSLVSENENNHSSYDVSKKLY